MDEDGMQANAIPSHLNRVFLVNCNFNLSYLYCEISVMQFQSEIPVFFRL